MSVDLQSPLSIIVTHYSCSVCWWYHATQSLLHMP